MEAQCAMAPVTLTVPATPCFARLVRMTAANVAMLSSMSVDRVEDIRMAAEEAFIYSCVTEQGRDLSIRFAVDESHIEMTFELGDVSFADPVGEDHPAAYTDLILASVCDVYEKREGPAGLHLELRADV